MKSKLQQHSQKVVNSNKFRSGSPTKKSNKIANIEVDDETKVGSQDTPPQDIMSGKFRIGTNLRLLKVVYIPAKYMLQNDFDFDKVFDRADFLKKPPAVIFNLNSAPDPSEWNVRLPVQRGYLQKYFHTDMKPDVRDKREKTYAYHFSSEDYPDDDTKLGNENRKVMHYQGVIRENCRRILQGTVTACLQAGAHFRTAGTWNGDCPEDFFAQTVASTGSNPVIFGASVVKDFHPMIFSQIINNMDKVELTNILEGDDNTDKNKEIIVLDPKPFYDRNKDYITITDPADHGIAKNSFPHPNITHLIMSDNREILENKLLEIYPNGMIVVNGDDNTTTMVCKAIQLGWPIVAFKYTGGTADLFAEMHEKLDQYLAAKTSKQNKADMSALLPDFKTALDRYWLKPFEKSSDILKSSKRTTVLMENWSERFNPMSVFIVDLFKIAEDEVQDRITQTMAVVTEAHYELGALASEQKRLTYAWRVRHKFIYNALIFSILADVLMILITLVTMSATISAVLYTFLTLDFYNPIKDANNKNLALTILLNANLLLPLVATVFRGLYSSLTPNLKYVALKNAAMEIESEIYLYRTKVGRYSSRHSSSSRHNINKDGKNEDKDRDMKTSSKARVQFSLILDQIWADLAASDLQNGSLRTPHDTSQALTDINARIQSNLGEQDCYLKLIGNLEEMEAGKRTSKDKRALNAHDHHEKKKWYKPILACCSLFASNTAKIGVAGLKTFFASQLKDDGVSPLSADEYVRMRMIPTVAYYSSIAPGLSVFLHFAGVIGVFLSVASSALSSFNLAAFLPAVLAFSGSLTDWMNYRQIELRLIQTNSAMNGLNKLLVWWECLSMIEKRNIFNKDALVHQTESIIKQQATIFSGGSSKKRDSKNDDDDDE